MKYLYGILIGLFIGTGYSFLIAQTIEEELINYATPPILQNTDPYIREAVKAFASSTWISTDNEVRAKYDYTYHIEEKQRLDTIIKILGRIEYNTRND